MTEKHPFYDLFAEFKRECPEANIWLKGHGFLENPDDVQPENLDTGADALRMMLEGTEASINKSMEFLQAISAYQTDIRPAIENANQSIARIVGYLVGANLDDERTQFLLENFNTLRNALNTVYAGLMNFSCAQDHYMEHLVKGNRQC